MIWILIIAFPLFSAALSRVAAGSPAARGSLLAAGAVPALAAGLELVPVGETTLPWLFLGAEFGLDAARSALLVLAALLWGTAGAFAGAYLKNDPHPARFAFFFLLAMSGTFGLIVAQDVPSFYTFFVLMTFASYPLIIHTGNSEARRAGRIYLVMAILGELCLIYALYAAVRAADSILLADLAPALAAEDNGRFVLLLGLIGFGVKAGAVPLYFWLPLAHPVAPTPASAVLSGVMIKAGLLGWLHLAPLGTPEPAAWASLVIVLGLVGAFGAVALGFFQTDPKTNLAYSSISQMGLMTVLLGLGLASSVPPEAVAGAVTLYALHHGLAKGALFLGTGVVAAAGRGRSWVMAGLAAGAVSIAGAPLTGGALAKYALKDAAGWASGPWEALLLRLLPLSALATSLLLGRFLWLCWKKPGGGSPPSAGIGVPWGFLVLAALVLPWWANSYFELGAPAPGVSFSIWFEAAWPLALGAGLLYAGLRLQTGRAALPTVPAGDLIVPVEKLAARCAAIGRRIGLPDPARGAINLVSVSDRLLAMEDARALMDRAEARLSRWHVVGALFLLLILCFILAALKP